MELTFFFYDLETSGLNPHSDRIMQFAGRRTSLDLEPIGEPYNELIALTDDILPSPSAIMVTGITPQQTLQDGWTETGFIEMFNREIATPGTIFIGYNSVRFDDEFIRCLLYRNLYDPYEWQWQDGRGRWDLLDVIRMTRALRPAGISWPVLDGKPTNRLELITKKNGLEHSHAHDALSDVEATIAVARLIKDNQPKLFDWLFKVRAKNEVKGLIETGEPFVYTSGKYSSEFNHTSVAVMFSDHPGNQGALVYDLRFDPGEFIEMSPEQLADRWRWQRDRTDQALPVKTLQYNRCPAVAPLGVLDDAARQNIKINLEDVKRNLAKLKSAKRFAMNVKAALKILDDERAGFYSSRGPQTADERIYDGFVGDKDKKLLSELHQAQPETISAERFEFNDKRLNEILPLYKARNYPKSLTTEEKQAWENYRTNKLTSGGQNSRLAKYLSEINRLRQSPSLKDDQAYLLDELQLYGQSIAPDSIIN